MAPPRPRRSLLRPSLATKIVGQTVLSVTLTIAYFAIVSYRMNYQSEEERFGLALDRIAATAALSIDGDAHRRIQSNGDAASPEFRRILDFLAAVRAANYLPHEDQIYTFHVVSHEDLRFAVMLQEKTFIGDRYHMVAANVPVLMQALDHNMATHTKLYRDEHGTWVSAYAPIRDSHGAIAGVLEVDYTVDQFLGEVNKKTLNIVFVSLIGLALSVLLSVALAIGVRRALRRIRSGIEAIRSENFSFRIRLQRSDELGLVAQQVNRMAETLSERFHMLKFLPRHTLEAIVRRSKLGESHQSERVHGAVFFSDIRGYTALSADTSDEELVQMLNHYLRRQAEIVQQHGGSIDKFMGDAVLALFVGEHAARQAVAAALEIRSAVDELNQKGVFRCPVHIGIGVSVGEMVLGEIGSEDRRERTPLGSVVNLASRLGSRAGSEEILVSEAVRAAIGPHLHTTLSQPVILKGFGEPQLAHWVESMDRPPDSAAAPASGPNANGGG